MGKRKNHATANVCEVARKRFGLSDGEMSAFRNTWGQMSASSLRKAIPCVGLSASGNALVKITIVDNRSAYFRLTKVDAFLAAAAAAAHADALWVVVGCTQNTDMEKKLEYWVINRATLLLMRRQCTKLYNGDIRTHFASTDRKSPPIHFTKQQPRGRERQWPPEDLIADLQNFYDVWELTSVEIMALSQPETAAA